MDDKTSQKLHRTLFGRRPESKTPSGGGTQVGSTHARFAPERDIIVWKKMKYKQVRSVEEHAAMGPQSRRIGEDAKT